MEPGDGDFSAKTQSLKPEARAMSLLLPLHPQSWTHSELSILRKTWSSLTGIRSSYFLFYKKVFLNTFDECVQVWPDPGEPSGLCNWHILDTAWNEEFWGHRRKILAGMLGEGAASVFRYTPVFKCGCLSAGKSTGLGDPFLRMD